MDAPPVSIPLSVMIRLLPCSEEKVASWQAALTARMGEAQTSIRDEEVQSESWFEVPTGEHRFMFGLMRTTTGDLEVPKQAETELDRIHTDFKRSTWDRSFRIPGELLSDADLFDPHAPGVVVLHVAAIRLGDLQTATDALEAIGPEPGSTGSVFKYVLPDRCILGLFTRASSLEEARRIEQFCIEALCRIGVKILEEHGTASLLDVRVD